MKKLVIVESPTKVKSITKYLGKNYIVKASMGHVRDLPEKKFGVDIDKKFRPQYVVPKKNKVLVSSLKKAAGVSDEIYLAPDPDREGEAIAWHLKELLSKKGDNKKIWRVTFNEITKDAILNAFKKPRRIDEAKVDSQQARRILDRIVGYKISPLLWRKVKSGLSAGRVQSVALRLICERESDIEKFKQEEYWSIEAKLHPVEKPDEMFVAKLEKFHDKKIKINNQAEAGRIVEELKEVKNYVVSSVQKKERLRRAVPPFKTSLLQQAAINTLGFTAHKTMFIAQQLYEGIEIGESGIEGLITYMRTDSFRIAREAQNAARNYIENKYGKEYLPPKPPFYKSKKGSQEAHEAIRPTSLERTPESIKEYLTPDQFKLYSLIWNRFIASQMENARLSVTTVLITADKALFRASGTEVEFPGFFIVYEEKEDSEEKKEKLPQLSEGEQLALLELLPAQHFTKPPPPYTEASLVKILEEKGIGRPSTYAPIVYTIIRRNYVIREDRKLRPTELGKVVVNLLIEGFPDIMEVEFTAKMEDELDEVERGKLEWTKVLDEFYAPFAKNLETAQKDMKRIKIEPVVTEYKCPKCSKPLVIRSGRYGQFMACSGFPECKHTEPLATNFECPEPDCNGTVVQRVSRKGRRFYGCSNYPKCTFTTSSLKKLETAQNIEE